MHNNGNTHRLHELLDKELYAYWRQVNYVIPADPDEDEEARQEREKVGVVGGWG